MSDTVTNKKIVIKRDSRERKGEKKDFHKVYNPNVRKTKKNGYKLLSFELARHPIKEQKLYSFLREYSPMIPL